MKTRYTALTGLAGLALVASAPMVFAADSAQDSDGAHSTAQKAEQIQSQSQGMYSADQLMDADVYGSGDAKNAIGEVEDVLLDNNMTIKSFVVETKGKMGLGGGKSYVVSPDQLTVQTLKGKEASKPEYRVNLQMTRDELAKAPAYSDSWWSNAQEQATDAWQQTKESASSAWTRVKKTTSNIVDGTKDKASDAADATGDAADSAADKTQSAASKAADKTQAAADDATDNN